MTTARPAAPSESIWAPAPENLKLARDELLVFRASLDLSDSRLADLTLSLSEDERARAARFRFDKDRRRFIAGRGLLRELLGWLLRVEASLLVFGYTGRGKPVLAAPASGHSLHFNLAHADSLAVYAVAWEHEVGIDIERLRTIMGADAIAERFFSEKEFAQWRSVSCRQQMEAFFNCWTRKEACLKATGDGLSESLDQVEVSLIPGQPVQLLNMPCYSRTVTRWLLQSLSLGPAYLGAVAAPHGSHLAVNCWQWSR
jgi:4'-phosphopantetheinyl transferase